MCVHPRRVRQLCFACPLDFFRFTVVFADWLGKNYYAGRFLGNDPLLTNVPRLRIEFREKNWEAELAIVGLEPPAPVVETLISNGLVTTADAAAAKNKFSDAEGVLDAEAAASKALPRVSGRSRALRFSGQHQAALETEW